MHIKSRGFTLVELLITIVIIGIISVIAVTGYVVVQRDQKNTVRETKTSIIAGALEKYYEKNGEYPSVASIAGQTTASLKQKLDIASDDVLLFPGTSGTIASIYTTTPSPLRLVYAASTTDSNANSQCQTSTNGYCDAFTLSYTNEFTNDLVTVKSLHNSFVAIQDAGSVSGPPAPTTPAINGQKISSTDVRFTASSSVCTKGTLEYKIRYSTTSTLPDWSTITWSTSNTKDINPGSNTVYYSQALAHCLDAGVESPSVQSATNVLDFTPVGTPPATPSVSAYGNSTSSIYISWGSVVDASSYTVRYGTSSASTVSACSSSPCTISGLYSSTTYQVSVTANNSFGSSSPGYASATTNTAGTPPSAPAVNASPSYDTVQLSWTASSGTATIYYSVSGAGNASSCTSSPCTVSGLSTNTTYTFTVTASNSYGSASGSTSTTTYAPALVSGGSTALTAHGRSSVSWYYTPSSYTPPSSMYFSLTSYPTSGDSCKGYQLSSTTRSCYIDLDPCKYSNNVIVSDSLGRSTSVYVAPWSGTKPTINVNGSTKNSNNTITVNWNYGGDISWVQIKRTKNGTVDSYVDNIYEGSGGSGSWTSGTLGAGDYYYTVAAANCRYRAGWSFGGTNYDNANTDSTVTKTIN